MSDFITAEQLADETGLLAIRSKTGRILLHFVDVHRPVTTMCGRYGDDRWFAPVPHMDRDDLPATCQVCQAKVDRLAGAAR